MASLGAGTDIGKLINLARRKNQKYDRTFSDNAGFIMKPIVGYTRHAVTAE